MSQLTSFLADLLTKIVQANGSELPRRQKINFIGGSVTDDPANDRTNVSLGDSAGEANTNSNAGSGAGQLVKAKVGVDTPIKTIAKAAGDLINVANGTNEVTLSIPNIKIGTGDPNGSLSASRGDVFIRTDSSAVYQNTDGGTTWGPLGGGGVSDHGALTGLSDDDHAVYALLAGRAGGQTLTGGTASGNNLDLSSTSHATKGNVNINGNVSVNSSGDITLARYLIGRRFNLDDDTLSVSSANDWASSNWNDVDGVRLGVSGVDRTITGFDSSGISDGEQRLIINDGSKTLLIPHASSSSLFGNRVSTPGEVTFRLPPDSGVWIQFSVNQWFIIAQPPGGWGYAPTEAAVAMPASINNYSAGTANTITFTPDGAGRVLTGIELGDHHRLLIRNGSATHAFELGHDTTSASTNRFVFASAANISIGPKESAVVFRNSTDQRWNLQSRSSGGAASVTSVFTRTGAVVAEAGDYNASQVDNDSNVPGDFVDDALNSLLGSNYAIWSPGITDAPPYYGTLDAALAAVKAVPGPGSIVAHHTTGSAFTSTGNHDFDSRISFYSINNRTINFAASSVWTNCPERRCLNDGYRLTFHDNGSATGTYLLAHSNLSLVPVEENFTKTGTSRKLQRWTAGTAATVRRQVIGRNVTYSQAGDIQSDGAIDVVLRGHGQSFVAGAIAPVTAHGQNLTVTYEDAQNQTLTTLTSGWSTGTASNVFRQHAFHQTGQAHAHIYNSSPAGVVISGSGGADDWEKVPGGMGPAYTAVNLSDTGNRLTNTGEPGWFNVEFKGKFSRDTGASPTTHERFEFGISKNSGDPFYGIEVLTLDDSSNDAVDTVKCTRKVQLNTGDYVEGWWLAHQSRPCRRYMMELSMHRFA